MDDRDGLGVRGRGDAHPETPEPHQIKIHRTGPAGR